MTDLKAAVFTVLEGWALPLDARKILETAYYAQPEQEPVAHCTNSDKWNCKYCRKTETCEALKDSRNFGEPSKPWVGLTDEEIKGILDCGRGGLVDIKKAEQLLKEKNT